MQIGIIDVNDVRYADTDMAHTTFTPDKMQDLIADHVVLKTVADEDGLMETILAEVPLGPDYPTHTSTVVHVGDDLYLMCHMALLSKEIYESCRASGGRYNGIASYLSDMGMKIYGKAVFFKIDTASGYRLVSVTEEEIARCLATKFVHQGVLLNPDGTLAPIRYIFNPIDWVSPADVVRYKYHETEFLGKVLMLFHDTTATVPNDGANVIYSGPGSGSTPIKGRVIVGMRERYTDMNDLTARYCDLDPATLERILALCRDPLRSRELTPEEDLPESGQVTPEGKRHYTNFHKILAGRSG